ncbi:hypothetical protein ACOSP7_031765 [Xanthoceras sorbifolium]
MKTEIGEKTRKIEKKRREKEKKKKRRRKGEAAAGEERECRRPWKRGRAEFLQKNGEEKKRVVTVRGKKKKKRKRKRKEKEEEEDVGRNLRSMGEKETLWKVKKCIETKEPEHHA